MNDQDWLAERFEQNRGHLRAQRSGRRDPGNLAPPWTVGCEFDRQSRRMADDGCRSRVPRHAALAHLAARRISLDTEIVEPPAKSAPLDPQQEAVLADSVGLALLVVLDRLSPAERLAFVLHDLFAMPSDEIARIVGRTEEATRQLASRARRRVQGEGRVSDTELHQQRDVVDKFLAALRAGDFDGLVALLEPDVLVNIDEAAAAPGAAREIRGAATWAKNAIAFSRGARFVRPVLVDGSVGAMLAPQGHLSRVLRLTIKEGKIRQVDIIGDPVRLQELDLAVLEN